MKAVFDLVEAGKARPVNANEIPMERASDAHHLLQERSTIGKVLLSLRES